MRVRAYTPKAMPPTSTTLRTIKKGHFIMKNKKVNSRFTIQLNKHNPLHVHVAGILNGLKPRSKAKYLVEAILEYEKCGRPEIDGMALLADKMIDEKGIEAAVLRILNEKLASGAGSQQAAVPASPTENKWLTGGTGSVVLRDDEIDYDESLDALSGEKLSAIHDAIESLRRK